MWGREGVSPACVTRPCPAGQEASLLDFQSPGQRWVYTSLPINIYWIKERGKKQEPWPADLFWVGLVQWFIFSLDSFAQISVALATFRWWLGFSWRLSCKEGGVGPPTTGHLTIIFVTLNYYIVIPLFAFFPCASLLLTIQVLLSSLVCVVFALESFLPGFEILTWHIIKLSWPTNLLSLNFLICQMGIKHTSPGCGQSYMK